MATTRKPTDLSTVLLTQIRDSLTQTNARLDRLSDRVGQLSDRVEQGFGQLSERLVHTEIRLATELVAVAGAVESVTRLLKEQGDVRPLLTDHEQRLATLERKLA